MNSSISQYKDTDREILLAMSDKDLLATCSLNKYLFNNVCDDNFFHKKLLRTYPDSLKYFNRSYFSDTKTYKQYYLKVVYYISKLKEEFDYSYTTGNPVIQYNIFKIIKYKGDNNQELLWEAAARGDLELVKEAIKKGADIHELQEYALKAASRPGHLELVKYLVSLGVDINAANGSALKVASEQGHLDVVKYLVSLGANIHVVNEGPLRWAAFNGQLEVVKYLVSLGADISADNNFAIKWAKHNRHSDVADYLSSL